MFEVLWRLFIDEGKKEYESSAGKIAQSISFYSEFKSTTPSDKRRYPGTSTIFIPTTVALLQRYLA